MTPSSTQPPFAPGDSHPQTIHIPAPPLISDGPELSTMPTAPITTAVEKIKFFDQKNGVGESPSRPRDGPLRRRRRLAFKMGFDALRLVIGPPFAVSFNGVAGSVKGRCTWRPRRLAPT